MYVVMMNSTNKDGLFANNICINIMTANTLNGQKKSTSIYSCYFFPGFYGICR